MPHTPGPWRFPDEDEEYSQDRVIVELPNSVLLATEPVSREHEDGDSYLIAAAPNLLESCRKAVELLRERGAADDDPVMVLLRTSINIATVKSGD